MNVLLLFNGYRAHTDRLRIDVHKRMSEVCNFKIYGTDEHELDPILAPIDYNPNIPLQEIIDIFKADVILMDLHGPNCYDYITDQLKHISTPKAIIEEDHYAPNSLYGNEVSTLDWFKECKFDLIIRRHYYYANENIGLNTVWRLPSASEKIFYPSEITNGKLFFAGSVRREYYNIRRKAIEILSEEGILNAYTRVKDYPRDVREHKGFLGCSGGHLHTPLTKTFEAMLSGVPFLCNKIEAKKELFGDKECYFEYKDDCSDIVEKANIILKDPEYAQEIANNARAVCLEKHTDTHRIKELYNILEALVQGKEIPRIWGQ